MQQTKLFTYNPKNDVYFIAEVLIRGGCNPKKPNATANFKFGTGFFGFFLVFFSVFFGFSILTNFDCFNGFLLSGSFWL